MQNPIRYFDEPKPIVAKILGVALLALVGVCVAASYAKAADKGGKAPAKQVEAPASPWTGCGVGGIGGWAQGSVDFGSPVKVGSDAASLGGSAGCDIQTGRGVFGVFVDYSWVQGDLKTIGINTSLNAGARAGYLVLQNALVYAGVAWSRIDADAIGHVDGYTLLGGVELKLPDAPIFVALEYRRGFFADVGGSGLDAETNSVLLKGTYKFNLALPK